MNDSAGINHKKQRRQVVTTTIVLLPVCLIIALLFGATQLSLGSIIDTFLGQTNDQPSDLIISQIRLPRALLAALVGALLGICGAATQGLFRNPLADPSLIGVTAGASAGAALVIFLIGNSVTLEGLSGISFISIGAFIGGGMTVLLVYKLSTNQHGTSVATMLLAGIAITAVAGGLTSLLEFFANNETLRRISLWRMGGLDGANYQRVLVATTIGLIIFSILPRFSTALNALLLGESEARHLGLKVQKSKISIIVLVAGGVGITVALAGSIAFVGLVVPHIIRLLIGPDHRYLLPISALAGAILMLLADTIARTVFAPIELPVGLVTALLGAPFFVSLLRYRHGFAMR